MSVGSSKGGKQTHPNKLSRPEDPIGQDRMPSGLRSGRGVLVVDDNPADLKLVGTLFEEEGLSVRLAGSVAEAKEILKADGTAFDLVLSDISMPGETGFDLLAWIKRDDSPVRELPVLLTTAQLPEAENRLKGLALGAVDYVVRPIDLKELVVRAIKAIEHFRRVKNLEYLLQDSENLAMVGRILAASNHEIKNLAALVKVCADQMERAFPELRGETSLRAASLRSLSEAALLLTDVARNASSLLDPKSSHTRPTNISDLVTGVAKLLESRVRPSRLKVTATAALWGQSHDIRLKQVIINLVLNAADAITELEPIEGGLIDVTVSKAGEGVDVTVTDNGIGLSKPGERTDFQAFATTKKLRGGQGLGLWLCSRLVQTMGGKLVLKSAGVGKGAQATVTMRACDPPAHDDADDLEIDLEKYLID